MLGLKPFILKLFDLLDSNLLRTAKFSKFGNLILKIGFLVLKAFIDGCYVFEGLGDRPKAPIKIGRR
jgi:hypothetical protein